MHIYCTEEVTDSTWLKQIAEHTLSGNVKIYIEINGSKSNKYFIVLYKVSWQRPNDLPTILSFQTQSMAYIKFTYIYSTEEVMDSTQVSIDGHIVPANVKCTKIIDSKYIHSCI